MDRFVRESEKYYFPDYKLRITVPEKAAEIRTIIRVPKEGVWYDVLFINNFGLAFPHYSSERKLDLISRFIQQAYFIKMSINIDPMATDQNGIRLFPVSEYQWSEKDRVEKHLQDTNQVKKK